MEVKSSTNYPKILDFVVRTLTVSHRRWHCRGGGRGECCGLVDFRTGPIPIWTENSGSVKPFHVISTFHTW